MSNAKPQPINSSAAALTRLINELGGTCNPTQFVREYVQNGIEAVQRTKKSGSVIIDYNEDIYDKFGLHKISFIDTGDGMTKDQMVNLLNGLAESGGIANEYENFGVGAKIAALMQNHNGIIYESWVNGVGHRIIAKYHPNERVYGLQPMENADGEFEYVTLIAPDQKPPQIDQHGTRVTLLGMRDDQDTMLPPAGGSVDGWLLKTMHSRYFRIPESVIVKIRDGYLKTGSTNYMANFFGQEALLNKKAEISGWFSVSGTRYHWWVMPENLGDHGRSKFGGHSAIIYDNEIYEIQHSSHSSHFGIVAGHSRIIIYVEPPRHELRPDVQRSHLFNSDRTIVSWNKWYKDFRDNMPKELDEFVLEQLRKSNSTKGDEAAIREKLKSVRDLFKLSRYRLNPKGKLNVDTNSATQMSLGLQRIGDPRPDPVPPNPTPIDKYGKNLATLYSNVFANTNGEKGSVVDPNPQPTIEFIDTDGLDVDPRLNDRIAIYDVDSNHITGNRDFAGFDDLVNHMVNIYRDVPNAESAIISEIEDAFSLVLTEIVMGALCFRHRAQWTDDDFSNAISPEALTTASMPRYWMVQSLKQKLGGRLKALNKIQNEAAE